MLLRLRRSRGRGAPAGAPDRAGGGARRPSASSPCSWCRASTAASRPGPPALPLYVAYLLLPILFAVAVLRYRLYDIEVIINRTVVAGGRAPRSPRSATSTLVVVVGDAGRTGRPAASGCPCWRPRWSRWPSSRCAARSSGWPTGWPTGRGPSPTRRCRTSAAGSPRRPSPETLLPAVADAAGRAVSRAGRGRGLDVAGRDPTHVRGLGRRPRREGTDRARRAACARGGRQPRQHRGAGSRRDAGCGRPTPGCSRRSPTRPRSPSATPRWRPARRTRRRARPHHAASSPTRGRGSSRRTTRPGGPSRRPSRARCCRTWSRCPTGSPAPARPSPSGRPRPGSTTSSTATNTALEALRELTRGVFPTQLARSGLEPALRSLLAPQRAGRARCTSTPRRPGGGSRPAVEAAVYFCCAEAVARARRRARRSSCASSARTSWCCAVRRRHRPSDVDLQAIVDRVEAVGGSVTSDHGRSALSDPGRRSSRGQPASCASRAAAQASESRSGPNAALATYAAAPQPVEVELVLVVGRQQHHDRGRPEPAVSRRVASMPSMPGRLTSISTRSGRSSAATASDSSPDRGRARRRRSRRSRRPRRPSRGGTAPGRRRSGRATSGIGAPPRPPSSRRATTRPGRGLAARAGWC